MPDTKQKDIAVTIAVLLVVVLVVAGAVAFNKKGHGASASSPNTVASAPLTTTTSAQTPTQTDTSAATATTASSPATQAYKDGTYTASADYATPESIESITVTVTIKSGAVANTLASASSHNRDSREYTSMFMQNYKSLVVGKSISDISLSRVSGSSLTSQGFNDAIAQIKNQATA
jgi:uncharacterized protein with FMN-binding domain